MRVNHLKKTQVSRSEEFSRPAVDDAIGFRSSLLALNAAVEAACRDGMEAGGGAAPPCVARIRAAAPVEGSENGI